MSVFLKLYRRELESKRVSHGNKALFLSLMLITFLAIVAFFLTGGVR